jgi:polar amino acid transport system substrate-binding protein
MTRRAPWLAVLGIALASGLAALAPQARAAEPCEMRVRWAEDPPYFIPGPGRANGHVEGLVVEEITETLARMGCRPVWVELPWARALVELQEGRIDIVAGALRRPEREAFAYFVDRRFESRNRLYVRAADLARLGGATTLAGALKADLRLGVQIGVVYGAEYSELVKEPSFRARLTQAATRRSLWQMLDLGRVDGVLASEVSARWELNQVGLASHLVPTSVVLSSEPTFVMLSRRSVTPARLELYRNASEAMERDGALRRITSRYIDH